MKCRLHLLALVGCVALLHGCTWGATMHTARALDEGVLEVGGAINAFGFVVPGGGGTYALPTTHVQMRYGLGNQTDFGVRLYPIGLSFDMNVEVLDAGDIVLSVAPTVEPVFLFLGDSFIFLMKAWATVLLDVRLSEKATFVMGLKPGIFYASARDSAEGGYADGFAFMPGGVLAFRYDLGKFAIMPEFNFYTLYVPGGGGGFLFEAGIGFYVRM